MSATDWQASPTALPLAVTSLMHGVFGGAQVGYNYQTGSWVYGLEADIQASDMSASYTRILPMSGTLRSVTVSRISERSEDASDTRSRAAA